MTTNVSQLSISVLRLINRCETKYRSAYARLVSSSSSGFTTMNMWVAPSTGSLFSTVPDSNWFNSYSPTHEGSAPVWLQAVVTALATHFHSSLLEVLKPGRVQLNSTFAPSWYEVAICSAPGGVPGSLQLSPKTTRRIWISLLRIRDPYTCKHRNIYIYTRFEIPLVR